MSIFSLKGRVAFITGGAGLLGIQHALAIREAGGTPILGDIQPDSLEQARATVGDTCRAIACDVTAKRSIEQALEEILSLHGKIDILVNNAARNPKVEPVTENRQDGHSERGGLTIFPGFADLTVEEWNRDLAVGITGAMLSCQVFGGWMARNGGGCIVNIGSEYALIAPDQSVYQIDGLPENEQPTKPVTYTVVKHAIVGLTKHLAVLWAKKGVRVNCLCPAGVEQDQNPEFKRKISRLIPMGHMAPPDHIRGALVFLCSDASSFMTGEVVAVNGGRTAW
jgi:NAD(P)-dependent dehydrogenase (short-subunit alcohol dehydrogenase family)